MNWFFFCLSDQIFRHRRLDPPSNQSRVAFHAVLEGNEKAHLGVNQTIKYNHTILNLGGAFDSIQGVFTAPQHGLYIFSAGLTSAANNNSAFYAELTKEGIPLARLNVIGREDITDQSSVTAIAQMSKNEQVWVKIIDGNDISIWGDRYSFFTGMLLQPLY